jgi:Flp pilus assembly protein CpaB
MRRKPARRPGVALTLRRRPRLQTALTVTIALLCGLAVAGTVDEAEQARAAWGSSRGVLVAREDLRAGERLDAGNTRVVSHPVSLVPRSALGAVPAEARLTEPVLAGEIVREERLAAPGASPVAARLPSGTRAMAIPVEPGTTPPLGVGDRVEVLVSLPTEAAVGGPPGFVLATDVPVVDVSEAAVSIAVGRDVAPRLAVAFGQGAVTLALVGSRG